MFLNAAPFAISLLFFPLAALGAWLGGPWMLLAPAYAFVAIPALDTVLKLGEARLDSQTGEDDLLWHRLVTWVWVPVQLTMIFGLIWIAANTARLTGLEPWVMAVAVGIASGGIGITYAHELIHQKNRFERTLGEVLMCSTLYGHWCTEHVYGHHLNVATPEDPATAREGESVYRFLPRVLWQTLASSWQIQREQLKRRGAGFFSRHNAFLRYAGWTAAFLGLAFALGGWMGIGLLVVQAMVAILLLELVDYIEHYGLLRRKRPNGKYEPTRPHHSWNSGHQASNWLLINLQRHSDHHFKPAKRFPTLQSYPESEAPQLPHGYPWMVLLSLAPPLFFKVMDPKLEAWKARFYPGEVAGEAVPA